MPPGLPSSQPGDRARGAIPGPYSSSEEAVRSLLPRHAVKKFVGNVMTDLMAATAEFTILAFAGLLIAAAASDWRSLTIPNRYSLAIVAQIGSASCRERVCQYV